MSLVLVLRDEVAACAEETAPRLQHEDGQQNGPPAALAELVHRLRDHGPAHRSADWRIGGGIFPL